MKFNEAIIKVLEDSGNLPMTSKEIWNKISESKLIDSVGKTPQATINTQLLIYSINTKSKIKREKSLFEIVESTPMKFRLYKKDTIKVYSEPQEIEIPNENSIKIYEITSKELNWKKLTIVNNNENIEYNISDCTEYTYIMEDKAHATIKIGKTKNDPELRLNQLKTANPSISLLHVFPSTQFSENELHMKFEDFRKDLEWFFHTKGLREFLEKEILKHNSIIKAFNKKNELNSIENSILSIIENN